MYFGGFLMRRPGSLGLRMAIRSVVTAVVAIAAGIAVESAALPKLQSETRQLAKPQPGLTSVFAPFQGHLRYVPVPALVLGIAAIVIRPARTPLAILATIASVLSLVIIAGTLVAAMAPLYQAPRELEMGV